MKIQTLFEIFEEIEDTRSKPMRIEILHKNSRDIKKILDYTYNPKIKWLLPKGIPPFRPNEDDETTTKNRIFYELTKIEKFTNIGNYPHMKPSHREKLFVQVLEYVHPKDAIILCHAKDKELPYKRLTKDIVEVAFPMLAEKWGTEKS